MDLEIRRMEKRVIERNFILFSNLAFIKILDLFSIANCPLNKGDIEDFKYLIEILKTRLTSSPCCSKYTC